jgi:LPXTG-motif cell wall-anchored protein
LHHVLPTLRRSAVVLAGTAATLVAAAAPALAHVEVEAQPSRALATNATLRLTAEAESATAGVAAVRIQLPAGLIPTDFRLLSGPPGWRLRGSGQVLDVRGPALPVGRDLELVMRVRQLPAARLVVLKTVQTYSDGHEDAWIEVQAAGAAEPDHPAPVLRLAAPAAGATPLPRATSAPASPSSAGPTPTPAPTPAPTSTPASAGSPSTGDDSGVGWMLGGIGIGFLLLGAALLALRRRSRAP